MICTKCYIDKPLDTFKPCPTNKNGRKQPCKICANIQQNTRRTKNRRPRIDPVILLADGTKAMQCKYCFIIKPLEQFHKSVLTKHGHQQPCKFCSVIRNKQRLRNKGVKEKITHPIYTLENGMLGMYCKICEQEKPLEDFPTSKHHKKGYIHPCKKCINEKQRLYRINNPSKVATVIKRWRKNHPEKIFQYNAVHNPKRRALQHNLPATFTHNDRIFMLSHWQHACAICHREEGLWWTLAMDHWIPLSSPLCPGTIAENILPLCHGIGGCNNSKNNRDPHQWLQNHFSSRKVVLIERSIIEYFEIVRQRNNNIMAPPRGTSLHLCDIIGDKIPLH